ncbi:MAG: MFS transporter [Candidatus Paracaedimonas acanthamoebae]|uniref:MFS transporter n=1 Tax=Candidatus Paracaedimonas acanthamoebae TaxID=244581 RepID=A0A8J7TUB0_9PROT|nr:MFS transporter [Candidatus Paracaedimonas acanthamoebae]
MVIAKKSTILIVFAFIVTIIATDIYLPSFPAMAVFFKCNPDILQLSIPFYMFGGLLSTPIFGWFSDHAGRKWTIIGGLGTFILGTFFCFIASSLSIFLIGRFIQGVGGIAVPVVGWAVIQDRYPGEQGATVMSWMGCIVSLGPLLAPSLGGYIDMAFGWRGNFFFILVFSLSLILLMIFYFSEEKKPHQKKNISVIQIINTYIIVFKNKQFLAYIMLYSFLICGELCYLTIIPFFLQSNLKLTSDFIGIYISSVSLAYIIGTFLASRTIQYIGVNKTILSGIIVALIGALILLLLSFLQFLFLSSILLAIGLYMVGSALVWGPSTSGALQLFDEQKGAASAVRSLVLTSALGIGGLVGSVLDDFSIKPLAIFLVIMCLLSLFLYFYLNQKNNNS